MNTSMRQIYMRKGSIIEIDGHQARLRLGLAGGHGTGMDKTRSLDIATTQTTQPECTRAHLTQAATILGHQRVAP